VNWFERFHQTIAPRAKRACLTTPPSFYGFHLVAGKSQTELAFPAGAKWQDKHKLAILAWRISCMRIISKQLVASAIDSPDEGCPHQSVKRAS
jgi:hypothetical protein